MPTIDVTDAAQRLLDIIALPGQPGMFARRVTVQAWQSAGSPHVDSAGRLYAEQKHLYDGWREHLPGFNPADNPDDESQRLAHVRFVAFDIEPTTERIDALTAAGLIRPYTYEPWHWELPNVRSYALVRSIPATASLDLTPIPVQKEDDEMRVYKISDGGLNGTIWGLAPGAMFNAKDAPDGLLMASVLNPDGNPISKTEKELRTIAGYLGVPDNLIAAGMGGVNWSWAKDALAKSGSTTGATDATQLEQIVQASEGRIISAIPKTFSAK